MVRTVSSRAILSIAGIVLCVAVVFSWDAKAKRGDASSRASNGDSQAKDEDATQRGDRAFAQGKWAEARAAYDEILSQATDLTSADLREPRVRAIACSVKLHDFAGALRRATPFQPGADERQSQYEWPTDSNGEEKGPVEEVAALAQYRESIEHLRRDPAVRGDARLAAEVTQALLAADLDLMKILDPDVIPSPFNWGWTGRYPGMQWWVNAIKGRDEDDKGGEMEAWWDRRSIPLTAEGKPVTLGSPAKYEPRLPRSARSCS